jgi:glycosyltransferase involved in cell wall biosynthesis
MEQPDDDGRIAHDGRLPVSVIMIVRNESSRLRRTIASVSFARECIVVDGGSDDGTPELAASLGARVTMRPDWRGFGVQKQRALDLATSPWVLSIDADEVVSAALAKEIGVAIAAGRHDAYSIPRLNHLCGRPVRLGGWWPDRVVRLFRRGTARFSDDVVHERLLHSGMHGMLEEPLLHETYRSVDEAERKLARYAEDGAHSMHRSGRRCGPWAAPLHGGWMWFRSAILRGGLLGGRDGLAVSRLVALGTFLRYRRLAELSRNNHP